MNKHKEKRLEIKCPVCGSDNVSKQKQAGYVAALSILLLMIPLPVFRKSYHCFDCGHEWK